MKRVGDSASVRWIPTMWRRMSAMIRCASPLLPYAGVALRPPSLHTCGSHSDGWIDSGPLTIAARKPSSISRSMQSCGHRVGREEALELVELGIGEGFVEGAGIGHGRLSRGMHASEPRMIAPPGDRAQLAAATPAVPRAAPGGRPPC